ncbi:MAG TPA: type I-C CRISPR-associated endonuclease Cas1c [Kiritimatiellia bacterium]|jgi:CRISPR-associated protein Cas1|nr:type I-C CRISPR-associated endonuclease Cas1 [Kiritimatiellia bacterium]OQC54544.1 MAG: CRISPR-associated endonuclease Cas1 [Verrucomicrobia bacterium ADurb.Bin018]HOE01508.1 type I-C CRISPR-associated endonuclease Cas1c [Kiritimatiellia bacterium]HOE36995.1 type I-C CRISPR-associated endonuclease Cas1c [Kiritimatiellia bacterium]HOR74328.1 type I-C CRISPR-associated endonuclease Cas1c [Kiritimatiellia bacterium]
MKQLLNTLYITTQGSYLRKEGETIVVEAEQEVRARLPIHNIGGLVCFGNILCSPFLLGHCGENGVAVSFLTEYGKFLARVAGPQSGNVLLRREQYRRADNLDQSAELARMFVFGKVNNCRTVLQRHLRDHPDTPDNGLVEALVVRLQQMLTRLQTPLALDEVRGLEGDAARAYFGVFNVLLNAASGFEFHERSRRPPLDPINALLSFLYTLLAHDCRGACEAVGLDPQVGFLHRDRPGRPGLALDLMEEFRPFLVDRLVFTLINRQQITPKDFETSETGAVLLKEKPRKLVLQSWQERKLDSLTHPFLNEKMAVGLLPHAQAQLLARHLRGDTDLYPPFLWK